MPTDLPIRCSCGAVRGVARGVSGSRVNRLVCYCDDCQSFAHYLERADAILDAHGGTDIFQTSSARVSITQGADRLACIRLKPGGLVRWYAECCRTPIGNTLATRQVPFVGLIRDCTESEVGGRSRDQVLGPVRARVNARFAKGDRSTLDASDRSPPGPILRFLWILLLARLRGDHKRSPFFDPETGELAATPRVLTADELRAVEATRDAA